jgi:hypothetical protein
MSDSVITDSTEDDGKSLAPNPPEDAFDVILFVFFHGENIGPIRLTLELSGLPGEILSEKTDGELNIPMHLRTQSKRGLYWAEGSGFLNETQTYGEQGVQPGNLLILTDQQDPKAVQALVAILVNMESLKANGYVPPPTG